MPANIIGSVSARGAVGLLAALCAVARPIPVRAQVPLGNFTTLGRTGAAVTISAGPSSVSVTFYAPDIARVDMFPSPGNRADSSFAVIRDAPRSLPLGIAETDSTVTISSLSLRVICRKFPLRLAFFDSSGRELTREPASGGMAVRDDARIARFTIRPDEHFYGTGERGIRLDRRGEAFDSYNAQTGGYSTPLPTMNINVPFIASTRGYALYFDNTYRGRFDVGASDSTVLEYMAAGGALTYYLMASPTLAGEIERYTWLTGRQPLPPRWAFGYIQSKNRYRNETEARSIVDTMRARSFPCDAIVLDLQWFARMGDLRWDTAAWHDPGKMMSDFLHTGIKTILVTEPYVVETSINFDSASRLGYLSKDPDGRTYLLDGWWSCGGCNASLFDMTNPAAREWWWEKHPPFLGKYVAGLWTDLGEPERHPTDMRHYLGPAGKIHNIYDLLWAKTVFEGMGRFRPGQRVFNLTRSGFAGIQRYGVITWSGDVSRSFGGLQVQLPMMLNMGMSGLAYQNSDIGGYARNPTTPELYVRWMEFGVFTPVTRAHGAGESVHGAPTEPWKFGPEAEGICRGMLGLRYTLLPYNYTMAFRNYESGLPLARPLIMMYPQDGRFANESSTYMWGDDFLVSPVVEAGVSEKSVAFPEGDWVNFWTDDVVHGGRSRDVAAPLGRIPLFVRSGSIVPMAPAMNYSNERALDTLMLGVYPGKGDSGSGFLYEDDGTTTAYQRGAFALTEFTQSVSLANGTERLRVDVGPSRGVFQGKVTHRTYDVEIHGVAGEPSAVTLDGKPVAQFPRVPVPRVPAYRLDRELSRLSLFIQCSTDSAYSVIIEIPTSR